MILVGFNSRFVKKIAAARRQAFNSDMNQEASEAIEILRTQLERPAFEGEEAVFPDLIDYVNAPGKSNATALLNKLREEGDRFVGHQIQNPEDRDNAARGLFSMLLAPYLSDSRIKVLYSAVKQDVDS
jgi:hypothetical protein